MSVRIHVCVSERVRGQLHEDTLQLQQVSTVCNFYCLGSLDQNDNERRRGSWELLSSQLASQHQFPSSLSAVSFRDFLNHRFLRVLTLLEVFGENVSAQLNEMYDIGLVVVFQTFFNAEMLHIMPLKVQYVRTGFSSNSYSRQTGGSISPD